MQEIKMPEKVKMAKVSLLVLGVFGIFWSILIIGLFVFFSSIFFIGSSFSGGGEWSVFATIIYGLIGLFFCSIYILFAVFGFLTAKGIKERKNWSKTVAIVMAVIAMIFGHFIGIALGVLILVGLLDKEAEGWFIN